LVMRGNTPKGGGANTERYLVMLDGTKLVPWDEPGFVQVSGVVIGDDGSAEGPGQFDRSLITSAVDISYTPKQVEVLEIEVPASSAAEIAALQASVDVLQATVDALSAGSGLSAPETRAEVAAALVDYTAPTLADLQGTEAALAALIDALDPLTAAEVAAAVWQASRASPVASTYGAVAEWASVGGQPPPSAADIATAVLDEALAGHQIEDTLGQVLQRVLDILEADVVCVGNTIEIRKTSDDTVLFSKTITGGSTVDVVLEG